MVPLRLNQMIGMDSGGEVVSVHRDVAESENTCQQPGPKSD